MVFVEVVCLVLVVVGLVVVPLDVVEVTGFVVVPLPGFPPLPALPALNVLPRGPVLMLENTTVDPGEFFSTSAGFPEEARWNE